MTVHTQYQHLKYSASQLFDLVADVERYPEFMPWLIELRIRLRKGDTIFVDMTIAAGPLRKQFSTVGVLHRPHWIGISSDDALFDRFEQRWTFEPAAIGGTNVEYHVDFKFRSHLLQMLMGGAFTDRAAATMAAFERRARRIYGGRS